MILRRIKELAEHGVGLDTETHLTQPGLRIPPLVCGSLAMLSAGPSLDGAILNKADALKAFCQVLENPDKILIGANIPYDLAVLATELAKIGIDAMPQIYQAFADNRIYDIQNAEALDAIAGGYLGKDPRTGGELKNPETGRRGRYSLSMCVDLVLGRQDAKANDEWRKRYAELENIPLSQWPRPAIDYPIDDAKNTIEVALAQTGHLPKQLFRHAWSRDGECVQCGTNKLTPTCQGKRMHRNLYDLSNQVWTAYAMHMGAAWGFRVNQASVNLIAEYTERKRAANVQPFIDAGIYRADGTMNQSVLKRLVSFAYGSQATCPVCGGTGKVASPSNPRSKINCFGVDADGNRIKTCDGTGHLLATTVPRSEKEGVSFGRDTLNESGDDFLMSLATFLEDAKVLKDYVPFLRTAKTPIAGHAADCPVHKNMYSKDCACPGPYRDIPLTLSPNPILDTGRVSYDGYIQLFPRKPGFVDRETGIYIPSLRECIEARDGYVFASVDYDSGELVTHAQSCLWIVGESNLAKALIAGVKPHNALGATMIGMSYEEFQKRIKEPFCKNARQAAKPPNFGYPGGMGPARLVIQAREQGPNTPHHSGPHLVQDDDGNLVPGYKGLRFCILMDGADSCGTAGMVYEWKGRPIKPICRRCLDCAIRLKDVWLRQWPENRPYFNFVQDCIDNGQEVTHSMLNRWPHLRDWYSPGTRLEPGQIMQHVSGRVRGGGEFNALANGFFQGLLGDLAKAAVRRISRECYDNTVRIPTQQYYNSKKSSYAGGGSPLYGSRLIVFLHDEVLPELPIDVAHDAAHRIGEIMVEEMMLYCPDLAAAAKAPPALMYQWNKLAEPVYHRGKLVPWTRDHNPKKCLECAA